MAEAHTGGKVFQNILDIITLGSAVPGTTPSYQPETTTLPGDIKKWRR